MFFIKQLLRLFSFKEFQNIDNMIRFYKYLNLFKKKLLYRFDFYMNLKIIFRISYLLMFSSDEFINFYL